MVAPVLRVNAPRYLSDLLKWEVDPNYVREIGTLKAGASVVIGTLLAKDGAGKLVPLAPAAGDTTATVIGLSCQVRDAGGADLPVFSFFARGPMIVADSGIVWPAGITNVQKAAALAALAGLGILMRPAY